MNKEFTAGEVEMIKLKLSTQYADGLSIKQREILDLQQENTQLKMQIDDVIKRYEEIVKDKLDEIINEYNMILDNHKKDLNYINVCTHQYNAMRKVLEELLENELSKLKEVKK